MSVVLALALAIAAPEEAFVPAPVKPRTYELEWTAPPGCPDADSIRKRILSLILTDRDGEGVLLVRGVVEETASGFSLALQTEYLGHRSTRHIEGRHHAGLGEATALVIATALEPNLNASHGPQNRVDFRDPPLVSRASRSRRRPDGRQKRSKTVVGKARHRSIEGRMRGRS